MGATAARSVLMRPVIIARARDLTHTLADGTDVQVTIHPSLLLRLRDEASKEAEYRRFVADLRIAAGLAGLAAERALTIG